MENKNKNVLIGALLAVVFVMAVGYAAFAQQLTINGTSTITSKWDVHMEDGNTKAVAGVLVSSYFEFNRVSLFAIPSSTGIQTY